MKQENIKLLLEKIRRVERDLSNAVSEENSEKKREVLSDYLQYLKDELNMLQHES